MSFSRVCLRSLSTALVLSVVASCGDDDNSPTPWGTWSSTPTPTPTPAPTPSSSYSVSYPAIGETMLASTPIGDALVGPLPCAGGTVSYGSDGAATGFTRTGNVKNDNVVSITLLSSGGYQTDFNGFGGGTYDPGTLPDYEAFERRSYGPGGGGEFQIARATNAVNLGRVTFGMIIEESACFYSGWRNGFRTDPDFDNATGFLDGFAESNTGLLRLYPSSVAIARDTTAGKMTVTLELSGFPNALTDPKNKGRFTLGTATAVFNPDTDTTADVSTNFGFSGTMTGYACCEGKGFAFSFSLTDGAGKAIWGAGGAEAPR